MSASDGLRGLDGLGAADGLGLQDGLRAPDGLRVSVVVPAHEEGEHVLPSLARILESVELPAELSVVVDDETDSTAPWVRKVAEQDPRVRLLVNTYGRGPARAIRYGIDQARAPVVVVTMADGSDDPRQIDDLCRLVERGAVIAAASRYAPGGQQVGGPVLKSTLSRTAGRSLHFLARTGTRDATNSFKAYDRDFVRSVGIHSDTGFEIGLELTAKAKRLGLPVVEIPTIWLERHTGVSNFKVWAWIPRYLRWYGYAFGPRTTPEAIRAALGATPGPAHAPGEEGA